jgi:hypothetical protein
MSLVGIGALMSGAGILGGALFGQKDPAKKQFAQMMKLYSQAQGEQKQLYAKALHSQKAMLPTIQKGYAAANKFAEMYGQTARQGAMDQSKQAGSAMQQSMMQRGLYNTTAFDNASRGISADLTRTLMGIDESVAGMKGQLATSQAQAEAGAMGAMSGFYQNYAAANTNLLGSMAGAVGNVQYQDPNAWLGSLTGIGGTLMGYGMTYGANKGSNIPYYLQAP